MEALVVAPKQLVESEPPRRRASSIHADVLQELIDERGGYLWIGEGRPLPKVLPFKAAVGENAFFDHAQTLVQEWLDPLLQALDAAGDPDLISDANELRVAANRRLPTSDGTASFQVAKALCSFVLAVQHSPNYLPFLSSKLSHWDRLTLRLEERRAGIGGRWSRWPPRW